MAITLTILQANGNAVRSAMAKLDFDGEATVPNLAELAITAAVLNAAGGNVNASAEIVTAAAGVTTVDAYAQAFVTALADSRTGAWVWLAKNTDNEYIIHFKAKKGVAQFANISGASYDATPV